MNVVLNYGKIEQAARFNNMLMRGKPFKYMNQKVWYKTEMFGKQYFWMQDVDGTTYLAKCDEYGLPNFS